MNLGNVSKYRGVRVRRGTGGIYDQRMRNRMLGRARPYGRDRTVKEFWKKVKEYTCSAFWDLDLFIDTGGEHLNEVFTVENLEPIFRKLLRHPGIGAESPNDVVKARIACYFIEAGFDYLCSYQYREMTSSHERTMNDAIDLGYFLLSKFMSDVMYLRPSVRAELEEEGIARFRVFKKVEES